MRRYATNLRKALCQQQRSLTSFTKQTTNRQEKVRKEMRKKGMRAKLLFGQEVNNGKTELVMYRGGIKQDWRVCEQKNRVEGVKGVISVLLFQLW